MNHILPYIPKHTTYVEAYCGAASLLFAKPPSSVEVLNDLNQEIINFFRVLQNSETAEKFAERVVWTPYSSDEFIKAIENTSEDPVDRAWAWFVRQNQVFAGGSKPPARGSWGKVITSTARGMAESTASWRGRLKLLGWWHDRLTQVQLDSRDALEVIRYWDKPGTFFYLDPPYVPTTRKYGRYQKEMTNADHARLVQILLGIKGTAILSGYMGQVYQPLIDAGWYRVDIPTVAHSISHARTSESYFTEEPEGKNRVETLLIKLRPTPSPDELTSSPPKEPGGPE